MKLMREIRFSALPPTADVVNGWSGWPSATRIAPHFTAQAVLRGRIQPATGYLSNTKDIDRVLRAHLIPLFTDSSTTCEQSLRLAWNKTRDNIAGGAVLCELHIRPTPHLVYSITAEDSSMVMLTQSFEFSAAHRLYNPQLSEAENHRVFGKCSNPNGHGHNYVLEVGVRGQLDDRGQVMDLTRFESLVREHIIDRFDHRHLNLDCSEFAERIPSVENIAAVIWEILKPQVRSCELARVRVWETPKTYAEVSAEAPPAAGN